MAAECPCGCTTTDLLFDTAKRLAYWRCFACGSKFADNVVMAINKALKSPPTEGGE